MVFGLHGVHGLHAVETVAVVHKNVRENVLLPKGEVLHVLVQLQLRRGFVVLKTVQVVSNGYYIESKMIGQKNNEIKIFLI